MIGFSDGPILSCVLLRFLSLRQPDKLAATAPSTTETKANSDESKSPGGVEGGIARHDSLDPMPRFVCVCVCVCAMWRAAAAAAAAFAASFAAACAAAAAVTMLR